MINILLYAIPYWIEQCHDEKLNCVSSIWMGQIRHKFYCLLRCDLFQSFDGKFWETSTFCRFATWYMSICAHNRMYFSRYMMTSWLGQDCQIIGPLWGESTSHHWTPFTKDQQGGTLLFSVVFYLSRWVACLGDRWVVFFQRTGYRKSVMSVRQEET